MAALDHDLRTAAPYDEVRAWIFDQALPLWGTAGVDRRDGGFVEQLDFAGVDAGVGFKRTRVTCRQIYVFSHASMMGWAPGAEIAEHGFAFLRKGWLGTTGGWARTCGRSGQVLDATPDLYDIAFALFALGWYVRATGDGRAIALARETLDFAKARLRPTTGEGFWHEVPPKGWRLQNPHMHLLEAMLVCFEATGEERYAEVALELADLFRTRFFDAEAGALAEYFTDDWRHAPGETGRIIEPGHQFEWAWILANLKRLTGLDTAAQVRSLVGFAERFGVDPDTHVTFNQLRNDGAPLDRGSRTWPNTERIKAQVARFEMFGERGVTEIAQSCRVLLDRYLATERPGLWVDLFDADGRPQSATVPASTLYHLFLAFAEILRVQPGLA